MINYYNNNGGGGGEGGSLMKPKIGLRLEIFILLPPGSTLLIANK